MFITTVIYIGMMFMVMYITFRLENNFPSLSLLPRQRALLYVLLEVGVGIVLLCSPSTVLSETSLFLALLYGFSSVYWGLPITATSMGLLTVISAIWQKGFQPLLWFGQHLFLIAGYFLLLSVMRRRLTPFQQLILVTFYASLVASSTFLYLPPARYSLPLLYILVTMLAYVTMGVVYLFIRDLTQVKQLMDSDALTHTQNVSKFQKDVADLNQRGEPVTVALVDIDFFKQHNDEFGHEAGDVVLKSIAQRLRWYFNDEESGIYRIGGDEFAVLVPQTPLSAVEERLRLLVETIPKQDILYGRDPISVTLSIGVTSSVPQERLKETIKRADQALYAAKEKGRGRIQVA